MEVRPVVILVCFFVFLVNIYMLAGYFGCELKGRVGIKEDFELAFKILGRYYRRIGMVEYGAQLGIQELFLFLITIEQYYKRIIL